LDYRYESVQFLSVFYFFNLLHKLKSSLIANSYSCSWHYLAWQDVKRPPCNNVMCTNMIWYGHEF
jgi:hypothetical protein